MHPSRLQTVTLPSLNEGVGNALRAAYAPPCSGSTQELERLLAKLR